MVKINIKNSQLWKAIKKLRREGRTFKEISELFPVCKDTDNYQLSLMEGVFYG